MHRDAKTFFAMCVLYKKKVNIFNSFLLFFMVHKIKLYVIFLIDIHLTFVTLVILFAQVNVAIVLLPTIATCLKC